MKIALILVMLLGTSGPAEAQLSGMFGCSTSEAADEHERWVVKNRKKPSSGSGAKVVSIAQMLDWKIPAGYKKTHNDIIPPRENRLYAVSGFVRKVKLSDDDCDFHLELAPSGTATTNWIIVEMGANDAALQKKVAGMFNLSDDTKSRRYNGDKAKKVTVTGYAFLDLSHQCKTWPSKGCNHGGKEVMTIWELHPIFTINWAE